MKLRVLYIIMCLFCLTAVSSCREEAVLPEPESNVPGKTLLTLNFTIDGQDAASRAVSDDSPEHPAKKEWEDNITSLQVFIHYADGTWEEPIYIWKPTFNENKYMVELDKTIDLSGATIYLGANLKLGQSLAFSRDEAYSFTYNGFNLVTDLAPYSTYGSDPVNRPHIAMFCMKGQTPTQEETTTENGDKITNYTIKESFSLKRMVAKVLVTCTKDNNVEGGEEDIIYVPVKQTESENFQGWIRQDEVKYLVNGLNRKTYIMQRISSDNAIPAYANVVDPNNDLSASPATDDFYFQPINELDANKNVYFRTTELFDKSRLNLDGNSTNPYFEGIYCPENTFALDDDIVLDGQQAQITHVCVAAKFTPKRFHVEDDLDLPSEISEDGIVACTTEAQARALLDESAKREGKPSGTYYYDPSTREFYTCGAGKDNKSYSEQLGGWGYYYAYVDNRAEDAKQDDSNAFYQHGQVERNRYYILNIKSFSNPFMSSSMDVHTMSLDWKDGGIGDITLTPNTAKDETTD